MKRFITDLRKYYKYAFFAARAKLKSEVTNSYLDWFWWILEPFCFMIIYTIIFGIIFDTTEEYFPVFIFSGNAFWIFFANSISSSVRLIKENQAIVEKVYIPKFILFLIELFVNGYKMLISFGIVALMLLVFKVPITWRIILLIPIFVILFLITFAIGTVFLHLGVYIVDLSYIVSILLNMMMFFTGIFYSVETRVPAPFGEILGKYNPVAFLMTAMRNCILYSKNPSFLWMLIWFLISILLIFIGIRTIYKYENDYVKVM